MIHQSRWGYHPCNYETYLKLRRLNKAYYEGLCLIARWQHWRTKRPHNRKGPEPVVPDVFRWVCASPIVAEFQAARHGVADATLVKQLGTSPEEIDRWVGLLG